MKTIHKYTLTLTDEQTYHLPEGFVPLSVQLQRGEVCLWILVDPKANRFPVQIQIIGTGHLFEPDEAGEYLGTVQQGDFVWHVFAKR